MAYAALDLPRDEMKHVGAVSSMAAGRQQRLLDCGLRLQDLGLEVLGCCLKSFGLRVRFPVSGLKVMG